MHAVNYWRSLGLQRFGSCDIRRDHEIFDHTVRVDQAGREERGLREPVRYVHNDQTLRSAPRRVRVRAS